MTQFHTLNYDGTISKSTDSFAEIVNFAIENKDKVEFVGVVEEGEEVGTLFTLDELTNPRTTEDYWDCNCDEDYIHSDDETFCPRCGAMTEDQPDSIISEVLKFGLPVESV